MNLHRLIGILLVVESLLIFAPMAILGAAVNWPASLGDPAAVILPAVQANLSMVRVGYLLYLVYSLLFLPVGLLVARTAAGDGGMDTLLRIAAGFAVVSTLARAVGILRWLSAIPALAAGYVDPATTEAGRATIELVYRALNDYGGAIGEALGVSLFAALWLALTSLAILRGGPVPRWLGWFGLSAAVVLALPALELLGLDLGPVVIIATAVVQFWFLAAGVRLLVRPLPAPQEVRLNPAAP